MGVTKGLFCGDCFCCASCATGAHGILLIVLVLLHKGRGGGLSDMFGGGVTSNLGASGVAERNLNRITVFLALIWFACIIALAMIQKLS